MWSSARRLARVGLRRIVYPALTAVWAAGFGLAGVTLRASGRARARPWTPAGGRPVLAVAPHPDDEVAGCGGALALHAAAGDPVHVLILTDGGASRAGGLARAAIVACRADEARAAAAALGIAPPVLAGLPEGRWPPEAGTAALAAALTATQPAIVYAPSPVDYHPEHQRTAQALAAALARLPPQISPKVRIYEVFVPLGPGLANRVAAIGAVAGRKVRALAAYRSQAAGLAQVPRRDRYVARLYGLPRAAEGFRELSAAEYRAFVATGAWSGRTGPFRGLRGRPWADPLAYLAGTRRRSDLRRAARLRAEEAEPDQPVVD